MTINDVKKMAESGTMFEIVGRPGLFYIANVEGIYCDMVNEFENGMRPASNGPIAQTAAYLTRMDEAGMLRILPRY